MANLKSILRGLLPGSAVTAYRRVLNAMRRRHNQRLSTREVFERIYSRGEWGGGDGVHRSGTGSTEELARQYSETVRRFIRDHGVRSVVDLGCGDFRVGRALQTNGVHYTGVDIVESVIAEHRENHSGPETDFRCLNIIEDELPSGDLCLIRQVLQHLSNEQIGRILHNVRKFRWVIITEHYPSATSRVIPNLDKPHGGDTRLSDGSAVYLDQPPFSLTGLEELLVAPASSCLVEEGERIISCLWSPQGAERD